MLGMNAGTYLWGLPGVLEALKIWLAIGTTINQYPVIYTSMKQQTFLCLAAQVHAR